MTDWIKFGAAALATWRVTHLLANEDGPADLIALVRDRLGNSEFGALGCWGRSGIQRRQGIGRGCSRRTRSEACRFYEVAGQDGRLSRRSE